MRAIAVFAGFRFVLAATKISQHIVDGARTDGIGLFSLPFAQDALSSIEAISRANISLPAPLKQATRIDVHAHVVPPWYRAVVPLTAQNPTPNWTLQDHLSFMADNSIRHSILSISAPGSTVFPGSKEKSLALARLLNEYLAALVQKVPEHFSFYAVTPLPYTGAAIAETEYAINILGAAGVGLLSNHEGYYLGNAIFTPFFQKLSADNNRSRTIFVHPNGPCMHAGDGSLIDANPTPYPAGLVELYFETARTFMDLTISRTIMNFTALRWIIPHAGGSFPSIEDRFITSQSPDLVAASKAAYSTRFWWDAAGPVFPHQIQGLLGYGVPTSQLVYGSDFPYAPAFAYSFGIAAIENATFMTSDEKLALFERNSAAAFGS